jgi:hypothetical protein
MKPQDVLSTAEICKAVKKKERTALEVMRICDRSSPEDAVKFYYSN